MTELVQNSFEVDSTGEVIDEERKLQLQNEGSRQFDATLWRTQIKELAEALDADDLRTYVRDPSILYEKFIHEYTLGKISPEREEEVKDMIDAVIKDMQAQGEHDE